jgi:DNA-binding NtrC family response regulator
VADDGEEAWALLTDECFDVVLADVNMKRMDGLTLCQKVKSYSPSTMVIIITAFSSVDSAVQALRSGAYDYIRKPFVEDDVRVTVRNALDQRRLFEENRYLRRQLQSRYRFKNIVGTSEAMQGVFSLMA